VRSAKLLVPGRQVKGPLSRELRPPKGRACPRSPVRSTAVTTPKLARGWAIRDESSLPVSPAALKRVHAD